MKNNIWVFLLISIATPIPLLAMEGGKPMSREQEEKLKESLRKIEQLTEEQEKELQKKLNLAYTALHLAKGMDVFFIYQKGGPEADQLKKDLKEMRTFIENNKQLRQKRELLEQISAEQKKLLARRLEIEKEFQHPTKYSAEDIQEKRKQITTELEIFNTYRAYVIQELEDLLKQELQLAIKKNKY